MTGLYRVIFSRALGVRICCWRHFFIWSLMPRQAGSDYSCHAPTLYADTLTATHEPTPRIALDIYGHSMAVDDSMAVPVGTVCQKGRQEDCNNRSRHKRDKHDVGTNGLANLTPNSKIRQAHNVTPSSFAPRLCRPMPGRHVGPSGRKRHRIRSVALLALLLRFATALAAARPALADLPSVPEPAARLAYEVQAPSAASKLAYPGLEEPSSAAAQSAGFEMPAIDVPFHRHRRVGASLQPPSHRRCCCWRRHPPGHQGILRIGPGKRIVA